jgi:hypothetical protein
MEDELRLRARAAAAVADEAAYLRARLADADDGMCSFASEPHGAPLPASSEEGDANASNRPRRLWPRFGSLETKLESVRREPGERRDFAPEGAD